VAPNGAAHHERHFIVVARFVPKKNLMCAIEAYRLYAEGVFRPRRLVICGSGVLEPDIKAAVASAGLSDKVDFLGFVQSDGVSKALGSALALLLPSIEEQFGNVVIEAQALGVPVIISDNCGARDEMVRTAVNGFVVEPDNPAGYAFFMKMLADDEALWRKMSERAPEFARLGDVRRFADAAINLMMRCP
jgi:glycosyltransferase involved in cell wall biosynthesis